MSTVGGKAQTLNGFRTVGLAALVCAVVAAYAKEEKPVVAPENTIALSTAPAVAMDSVAPPQTLSESLEDTEDSVVENPLKTAYFGDLHVHTSFSLEAYIAGTRLTPDSAYRFAKGEAMTVNGRRHSIVNPLDFVAITDHAEHMGATRSLQVPRVQQDENSLAQRVGVEASRAPQQSGYLKYWVAPLSVEHDVLAQFLSVEEPPKSAWQRTVQAAVAHYEPGVFSTLVGFEWAATQSGLNMHRNILFRGVDVPDVPFTALESSDEEALWDWMERQEVEGRRLTAVPHKAKAGERLTFDRPGSPIDAMYAERRGHYERLIELTQVWGNSEVLAELWPEDEFADFENGASAGVDIDPALQRDNFIRDALVQGLRHDQQLNQNPFKLGFVGGSDSHNGTPGDVEEANHIGSYGGADATVGRRLNREVTAGTGYLSANPGSLTGVWASKNTRGEIWDALRARETFVTSGTRIQPRFFGGVGLTAEGDERAMIEQGYAIGVPMGGELFALTRSPTFTVHALKDPGGANLDRIQIIKGWLDVADNSQEKIVDVVWSGDRQPDVFGVLPAVGSTVDISDASYSNTIGSEELMGVWTDYDFDPELPAVYYVRVLEIPTPRWSAYDAVNNNIPLPERVPNAIQERAWTSPIWYTP